MKLDTITLIDLSQFTMPFLDFAKKSYFHQNILERIRDQNKIRASAKELYLICNRGFYNDPLLDWSNYRAEIQN